MFKKLIISISILIFTAFVGQGVLNAIDHTEPVSMGIIQEAYANPDDSVDSTTDTDTVDGEGSKPGDLLGGLSSALGRGVAEIASLLFKVFGLVVWIALWAIGSLMDNTFILEGEMGEVLRSVWVIIRNFVNIIFAIGLVIIALMSVVGYGDNSENYAVKKFIPKMALALIAVNFTFLACRIVLDVNNVLTSAVFAIPQSITTTTAFTGPTEGPKFYKKYKCFPSDQTQRKSEKAVADGDKTAVAAGEISKAQGAVKEIGGLCVADPELFDKETKEPLPGSIIDLNADNFSVHTFAWTMMSQFQGMEQFNEIGRLSKGDFTSVSINSIFALIFGVIYGMAYILLFIVLFVRVVALWIMIMFSPIAVFSFAIPNLYEKLPDEAKIQGFLDAAFVPLKVAIPLTIGYIMLSQLQIAVETDLFQLSNDQAINLGSDGEIVKGTTLQSVLYGAGATVVTWIGVTSALKTFKFGTEGIIDSVTGFVKGAGSTIAQAPLMAPLIPAGKAGQVSLKAAWNVAKGVPEFARRATIGKEEEKLKAAFGMADNAYKKFDSALDAAKNDSGKYGGVATALSSVASAFGAKEAHAKFKDMDSDQKDALTAHLVHQTGNSSLTTAGIENMELSEFENLMRSGGRQAAPAAAAGGTVTNSGGAVTIKTDRTLLEGGTVGDAAVYTALAGHMTQNAATGTATIAANQKQGFLEGLFSNADLKPADIRSWVTGHQGIFKEMSEELGTMITQIGSMDAGDAKNKAIARLQAAQAGAASSSVDSAVFSTLAESITALSTAPAATTPPAAPPPAAATNPPAAPPPTASASASE